MTAMLPAATALLAEMASLAGCERADGYACITARREHGASSVEIPQPQFAILLEGRKQGVPLISLWRSFPATSCC